MFGESSEAGFGAGHVLDDAQAVDVIEGSLLKRQAQRIRLNDMTVSERSCSGKRPVDGAGQVDGDMLFGEACGRCGMTSGAAARFKSELACEPLFRVEIRR